MAPNVQIDFFTWWEKDWRTKRQKPDKDCSPRSWEITMNLQVICVFIFSKLFFNLIYIKQTCRTGDKLASSHFLQNVNNKGKWEKWIYGVEEKGKNAGGWWNLELSTARSLLLQMQRSWRLSPDAIVGSRIRFTQLVRTYSTRETPLYFKRRLLTGISEGYHIKLHSVIKESVLGSKRSAERSQ